MALPETAACLVTAAIAACFLPGCDGGLVGTCVSSPITCTPTCAATEWCADYDTCEEIPAPAVCDPLCDSETQYCDFGNTCEDYPTRPVCSPSCDDGTFCIADNTCEPPDPGCDPTLDEEEDTCPGVSVCTIDSGSSFGSIIVLAPVR